MHARALVLGVVGVVCSSGTAGLPAQQTAGGSGRDAGIVTGEVIDAGTGLPLPGATVILLPEERGRLEPVEGESPVVLSGGRSTVTHVDGRYAFRGVPTGEYQLYVRRLGYRPTTLSLRLRGQPESRISVGLEVIPIQLEPLEVRGEATATYGRMTAATPDEEQARIGAARLRQLRYLGADVREITHADVTEAVTLAETDLFRALQRLPGVTTRDDWSAELWTRGARWDQTRVYFDGLPLLNPLHAFGGLSGVGTDAIGSVTLHPGVHPVSLGDGSGAVLDIRSRPGGGDGELRGVGELSLLSMRLALDQRVAGGRGAYMIAMRRSYLDWATRALHELGAGDDILVPFRLSDVTARVDWQLGPRRTLEGAVLAESDHLTGDIPDVLHGNRAEWGNTAARVTLATPIGRLETRHTVGVSRFRARIREAPVDPGIDAGFDAGTLFPMRGTVSHVALFGEVTERAGTTPRRSTWRAGYEASIDRARATGALAATYLDELPAGTSSREQELFRAALWGERRWPVDGRLTLETGLRLETGRSVSGAGAVRVGPRLAARFTLSPSTYLSAAAGRSFQYAQALLPARPGQDRALHPAPLWLVAGDDVPALRSDIATVGTERWVGGSWLVSATAYWRHSTGVVSPDPRPGALTGRPLFVTGTEHAGGLEIGARKLAGRWTGSAGYSLGSARTVTTGFAFPSPADRTHAVDLTSMLQVSPSLRLGAGFTATSGAPYTRYHPGTAREANGQREWETPPAVEAPNAHRGPAYASLDVLLDWTRDFGAWRLGLFAQLRNVLGRDNPALYAGFSPCLPDSFIPDCGRDRFENALPRLPAIGARISF